MEKNFQPAEIEPKIYDLWEKNGYFRPQTDSKKKPFVITLPLPNVTGSLHLGHAMFTIEDIMTRYHRMLGQPTLWLPGFDHASIAVEYLLCKQLAKEGTNKNEIGREEFLKRAHQFAADSKINIRNQLKKLGFSLDWSREAYTMDEERSKAVVVAFNRLLQKGLIYQGERIINWCPKCQTALSDLENEYQEEKGTLYFIKYGPITIATTRPETMFADVAVAVNPDDKKYQKLIGQQIPLPLTNRTIPVIADAAVDQRFGTGALKITPAHDMTDFEIGQRHKLERYSVVDPYGRLTGLAGKYEGMKVDEARTAVEKDLYEQGYLVKKEDYFHSVGHCQRCGRITEPLISKQWFVKTKPLAEKAIAAVKSGEIKIVPKRFTKVYLDWLTNIRDWCISRQLWWGHKIPIEGETDVLDTWFSSGLWPFSTLGWPQETDDLKRFFPNTVRETGYDIIFFWVAREVMLSLFLTGKVPYETIYLHGLVRDKMGQKMSKTKGNVIDPLDLISKFGTDALRMSLVVGNAPGNDLSLSEEKVKGYRNFTNKIWNAARYVLGLAETPENEAGSTTKEVHPDDKWILDEFAKIEKSVTRDLENYRFGQAGDDLYQFFWHVYCDQYIEKTKNRQQEALPVLLAVLESSLKLLHPFMPFITEEIWQLAKEMPQVKKYGNFSENALMTAPWPKSN